MLSVEIKVNGALIKYYYIVCEDVAKMASTPIFSYRWRSYRVDDGAKKSGVVEHRREDGPAKLMQLVLDNENKVEYE